MRKSLNRTLTVLILVIPTFCLSQWADVTFDTSNFYRVVKFQNQNEGLIMGDTSMIFKTMDGGNSWNNIFCPVGINLTDFQYINDTLVYAYGSNRIIKSRNSGDTWDSSYALPLSTAKVNFLNPDVGFAVGGNGIYKSDNAGMQWTSVWNYSIGPYGYGSIQDIKFVNDSIGLACGMKHVSGGGLFGIILRTTDSGNNWQEVYDTAPWGDLMSKVEIISDSNAYVSSVSTNLLKSTDIGLSWTSLNTIIEPYGEIESFYFKNKDTAYAVSSPGVWTLEGCTDKRKIFRTVDGWQSWILQYLDASNTCQRNLLNSISFSNDSIGFAVGYKKVLKTNNYGGNVHIIDTIEYITHIQTLDNVPVVNFYPNPTINYLNIETNNEIEIELISMQGLVIYSFSMKKGHKVIDMTNLANGIYLAKIKEKNNFNSRKIVKIWKM